MNRREALIILKKLQSCYPSTKGYSSDFVDILLNDFGNMDVKIFALIAKQLTYKCEYLPKLKDFHDEFNGFFEKLRYLPEGWDITIEKVEDEKIKSLGYDFYAQYLVNKRTKKKYPMSALKKISKDMILEGEITFADIKNRIGNEYKSRYKKQLNGA